MKTERSFKVGDVCRIRAWDDMVEEFGFDADDACIPCDYSFFDYMRYLCGETFTIKSIDDGEYYSEEGIEFTRKGRFLEAVFDNWTISADMLELMPSSAPEIDDDIDFDFNNLANLLGY